MCMYWNICLYKNCLKNPEQNRWQFNFLWKFLMYSGETFHLNNLKAAWEALSDGLPHHAKRPSRIEPEPEPIQQQVAVGGSGDGGWSWWKTWPSFSKNHWSGSLNWRFLDSFVRLRDVQMEKHNVFHLSINQEPTLTRVWVDVWTLKHRFRVQS